MSFHFDQLSQDDRRRLRESQVDRAAKHMPHVGRQYWDSNGHLYRTDWDQPYEKIIADKPTTPEPMAVTTWETTMIGNAITNLTHGIDRPQVDWGLDR